MQMRDSGNGSHEGVHLLAQILFRFREYHVIVIWHEHERVNLRPMDRNLETFYAENRPEFF